MKCKIFLQHFSALFPSAHTLHPSKRNISQQEVTTFQAFLLVFRAIAKYDDVSAIMLCKHPKWTPLHVFHNLVKCPIDILLKADILQTLAALDEAKRKMKNLERLPAEILSKIFTKMDDAGLWNLSETCRRFETIAKTAFQNRYFVIDGEHSDPEFYSARLNRFGECVKAIAVKNTKDIDKNHWVAKILQEHINRIEKLTFQACTFKSKDFLSQPMENITHLILRNDSLYSRSNQLKIDLPECSKLKKLEVVDECFTYDSLEQTIRQNPTLQRLVWIRHEGYGNNITLTGGELHWNITEEILTPLIIDKIVESFKQSESWAMCLNNKTNVSKIELLRRLGTECTRIKRLDLSCGNKLNNEMVEAVRLFQQIETLYLKQDSHEGIDALVEHLPNLRHLLIRFTGDYLFFSHILSPFRKCPSLEKITNVIESFNHYFSPHKSIIDVRFLKEFNETITPDKPNARFEVKEGGRLIGSVTRNGFIWRDKLLHWPGCDSNYSSSNVHLLALAKHPEKSNADAGSLLERIFNCLDASSLSLFAETGTQSKQLVGSYIQKRLQRKGTFYINDEFRSFEYSNFKTFFDILQNPFTQYVTDLKLHIIHNQSIIDFQGMMDTKFLNKWPKIRHIVFDTHCENDSDFYDIFEHCPDIETIEFKGDDQFEYFKSMVENEHLSDGESFSLKFRSLKKVIFNHRGKTDLKHLKEIFQNANEQLVPIFVNSAEN